MKTGMVSMADVAKYGRMDATFHLAVQDLKAELPALEASMPISEALATVTSLDTPKLQCLKPLVRGDSTGRKALLAAAQEYPYIAYALVRKAEADAA